MVAHAISHLKEIIDTRREANGWAFAAAEALLNLTDPYCLLAIDFVNAFNCIRRGASGNSFLSPPQSSPAISNGPMRTAPTFSTPMGLRPG